MPRIIFITHADEQFEIEAKPGLSLMEAAVGNSVPGIDADCGGACACATCHVYLGEGWSSLLGDRGEMERSMLDFAENVREESRLACQIIVTGEMDGLRVNLPESQH